MIDRRALLAAAAAAALARPAWAQDKPTAASAALTSLLDRLVEEGLERAPRSATGLGLDTGARASLRGRVEDRSAEARARQIADDEKAAKDLAAIDRAALSPAEQITYDTVEFQLSVRAEQAKFPYRAGGSPYVIDQRTGAYSSVPDFMVTQHPVKTAADAEAYLSRLDGFAKVLDQETEAFLADAEAGALPPGFLLETTVGQLKMLRDVAPPDAQLVRNLATKAGEARLGDRYAEQATDVFATKIVPALDRQITAVDRLRAKATGDAGVWKLPDGARFYATQLRGYTTTSLSAEEVHKLGLEQVADLTAQLDAALKQAGFTQGTPIARLKALNERPGETYANDEAGRTALLADLNAQIAALQPRLPQAFERLPKAAVEVRRVPEATQDGAANGYYQRPSLDGSRPGAFYINLKDTTEWPKWSLPTLTYHEAVPGHHLESALSLENPDAPLYRRAFASFSAYSEGWGLYAEQVADELGAYADYPIGKVGLIQSYLFRAARLVVDTGLHHKRWTREQANTYMVDATGDPPGSIAREIDRYISNPGQACSYKLGQTVILREREAARKRMGAHFDIKRFHTAALSTGRVPLTVLERVLRERLV